MSKSILERKDRSRPVDQYTLPEDEKIFAYLDYKIDYVFDPPQRISLELEKLDDAQSFIEALYRLRNELRVTYFDADEAEHSSEASTAASAFISTSRLIIQLRELIDREHAKRGWKN